MNFLSIPEEVIEGSLLPYLKWNDLLRFRRVCKVTHGITQGYLKIRPQLAPEMEISENDPERSFRAFLKMNIPTNRIFLNNPAGEEFYQRGGENVTKFLKECGSLVKHLRVKQFSLYSDGTFHFMEGLDNLQSFEAEHFGVGTDAFTPAEVTKLALATKDIRGNEDARVFWKVIPNIFRKLKVLRIEELILSLVNLHQSILPLNMPNLERVEIRAASRSSIGHLWKQQRQDWPALKSVDIGVDCKRITCAQWEIGQQTAVFSLGAKIVFQFFFQDVRRINMTEIRLNFTQEPGQVAVPKTDEIVASCPNLKKITLVNWPGTNKALIKLWDGLPALEEISLESCTGVGNVGFVGVDAKDPVFFKLKKLRKLSLKGLDKMPKITDLLFSLVLRHLNLTHLILTSDRPLKSVTSAGILSLLEGSFAEKIEKFLFQNWSLEDVSVEEFKKMESKFRCYNML